MKDNFEFQPVFSRPKYFDSVPSQKDNQHLWDLILRAVIIDAEEQALKREEQAELKSRSDEIMEKVKIYTNEIFLHLKNLSMNGKLKIKTSKIRYETVIVNESGHIQVNLPKSLEKEDRNEVAYMFEEARKLAKSFYLETDYTLIPPRLYFFSLRLSLIDTV